jgi:hypothetical protein
VGQHCSRHGEEEKQVLGIRHKKNESQRGKQEKQQAGGGLAEGWIVIPPDQNQPEAGKSAYQEQAQQRRDTAAIKDPGSECTLIPGRLPVQLEDFLSLDELVELKGFSDAIEGSPSL